MSYILTYIAYTNNREKMLVYMLFAWILLTNSQVHEAIAYISVLDKGIVPLEGDSVAIQFYVDIVNEDRYSTCGMRYWTKRCCNTDLEDLENLSCNNYDSLHVYGANKHSLQPRDRDTLYFVYPTLIQYDQLGTCNFVIDYNCGDRRRFSREEVAIKFDTRLKRNKMVMEEGRKAKSCDTLDLDSLNNCEPVDCNKKYIGTKPYFDIRGYKCIVVEVCEADPHEDLPDLVYDPKSNTCKDLSNPLTTSDIYAISSGLGVVNETVKTCSTKVQVKSNCSTISHKLQMLRDMMYGKLYPVPNDVAVDYRHNCQSTFLEITIFILCLCGLLLSLIFCIHIIVWTHKKWRNGDFKNCLGHLKEKCKKSNFAQCQSKQSQINKDVKNNLLKDVIVTNLPIELRESVADMCERVNREGKWKRRYRMMNVGSQMNLVEQATYTSSRTSSTTTLQEGNKNYK